MNTKIESTKLGATDLQVTRLDYGAARIDELPPNEAEIFLHTLLDEGITFIDTADCYGDSEELVGRFLGHRMQECVIATKRLKRIVTLHKMRLKLLRHIRKQIHG